LAVADHVAVRALVQRIQEVSLVAGVAMERCDYLGGFFEMVVGQAGVLFSKPWCCQYVEGL